MTSDEARAIIQRRDTVAFIGAGLPAPWAGSWVSLVQDIADGCGVVLDASNLPHVIDECIATNPDACDRVLRERLPFYNIRLRAAMQFALRLPFQACLTTNFDPSVLQTATREQFPHAFRYPDLPIDDGLKGVYYVHGYFDSRDPADSIRSLVFGERSFEEAYSTSLLPGFLLHVLTYRRVVFIGFNPLEDNFAKLLAHSNRIRRQVADARGVARLDFEHIALVEAPTPATVDPVQRARDLERIDRLAGLQVGTVTYEHGFEHRGLEELLYAWVEQGDLAHRAPPFPTAFDV